MPVMGIELRFSDTCGKYFTDPDISPDPICIIFIRPFAGVY